MIGLGFLLISFIWLVLAFYLAKLLTRILPPAWWRTLVQIALFVVLVPLPLIDQIVGGMQFKELCRQNQEIHFDPAKVRGKTVYLAGVDRTLAEGTWVPIQISHWRFVDATTREVVVTYNTVDAGPGLLRFGGGPLLFRGSCVPLNRPVSVETFKKLGISYIEPPVKRDN